MAALRCQSMNNLKQIALASHHYSDTNKGYLPSINGINFGNRRPEFSLFVGLLPFLEQGQIYSAFTARFPPGPNGSITGSDEFVINLFVSPADPTVRSPPEGDTSYAANALAFAPRSKLATSFPDGTSNTIAFAEHYGFRCGTTQYSWFSNSSLTSITGTIRRATFADRRMGDVYPITKGNTTRASVPNLTFQAAPSLGLCDPRLAQTPHITGMLVAFADGSVRTLSPGISEATYWSAVTPAGGETIEGNW